MNKILVAFILSVFATLGSLFYVSSYRDWLGLLNEMRGFPLPWLEIRYLGVPIFLPHFFELIIDFVFWLIIFGVIALIWHWQNPPKKKR